MNSRIFETTNFELTDSRKFEIKFRPLAYDKRASRQQAPQPNRPGAESPSRLSNCRASNISMKRVSTERLSQSMRQEELKAIMETRKSKRNTLTRVKNDRNSLLEETVLEDLCETTGLEAKNNTMR